MTKTEQLMEIADMYAQSKDHGWVLASGEVRIRLKAAIEEMVKDAARYQWLRKMDAEEWDSFFGGMRRDCNMKMLDVTIDEAMEKAP